MSLNKFSKLFEELDSNNSINKKINSLIKYFKSTSNLNNILTIYLLIGKRNKRFISGKSLRVYYSDIYKMPLWLVETCYAKVGDSAEVISLTKYFKSSSNLNNIWTIYLLIGKSNKRFLSGKLLREYYADIYKMPLWLIYYLSYYWI